MKFLGLAALFVVVWLGSAVSLAWTVAEVHAWWSFVPMMGFGAAVAITLPGMVIGAVWLAVAAILD